MRLRTGLGVGAVAIMTVLTVSACGGGDSESPFTSSSAPSGGSTSSSGTNSGSAPRVNQPLDAGVFQSDVCAALSSTHVQQLGLTNGTPRQSALGPSCSWKYTVDDSNRVDIAPHSKNQGGLSDLYDQKGDYAYFEPTMISGYPAFFGSDADLRGSGTCSLNVGVTDQLAILVGTRLASDKPTACAKAEQAAEAMIATLKNQ